MRIYLYLVLSLMLALASMASVAGNEVESKHRMAITHPVVIKEGGSIEEVLALAKKWRKEVTSKVPEILKTELLLEQQSAKEYELLIVYYFKDQGGELASMGKLGPLIKQAWPDEKERGAFFAALQSYIAEDKKTTHIYSVVD